MCSICALSTYKKTKQNFGSPPSELQTAVSPRVCRQPAEPGPSARAAKAPVSSPLPSPAGCVGWYFCYGESILPAPGVLPTQESRRKGEMCWAWGTDGASMTWES